MRPLSNFEKRIVKKLCEQHQFFSNLFEKDFLQDLIIEITNESINEIHEIKFLIKKDAKNSNEFYKKKMFDATDKIVQTINLLNYLKSQAYVYSFQPAHGISAHGFIGLKDVIQDYRDHSDMYVEMNFPDFNTYNFIFEYVNIIFVSTESLKNYLDKNYRTSEQIRHRQNMIAAWSAIIISMLLGLIGILCK